MDQTRRGSYAQKGVSKLGGKKTRLDQNGQKEGKGGTGSRLSNRKGLTTRKRFRGTANGQGGPHPTLKIHYASRPNTVTPGESGNIS